MSSEVVNSLTGRIASLEDIIRGQQGTLTVLLSRLRDIEQYVGAESRSREQTQQQLNQLLGDRGGAAQLADKLSLVIQNQNERISALQAETQGAKAGLQGIEQKYDAVFRGQQQQLQGDVAACYERIKAGETSTADALRTLQGGLQGVSSAVQQVDSNGCDAMSALQQQGAAELGTVRQRVDGLEASMRAALQEVHSSLSGGIAGATARMEGQLRQAVSGQNATMQSLDERVRGELISLAQKEQADVDALRQRTDEAAAALQASLQSAHAALSAEVAAVAQHSQGVEGRQLASHQMLLQELAKHDSNLETVDNMWRASVMELRGTAQQETAAARTEARAGDSALAEKLAATQRGLATAADQLNAAVRDLAAQMQERCSRPLEAVSVTVQRHGERLAVLQRESTEAREVMSAFAQDVDRNAAQFRAVTEAALRASHSDLADKITVAAAAATMGSDPSEVHTQINQALTKIWNDVSGTFVTQRDIGGVLKKIGTLESAVRVEVVALADQDTALHRRLDELQVSQHRLSIDSSTAAAARQPSVREVATDRSAPAASREVIVGAGAHSGAPPTAAEVVELTRVLAEAQAVAANVLDSAEAAEAAEKETVRTLNKVRALLTEMEDMRRDLRRQHNFIEGQVAQVAVERSRASLSSPSSSQTHLSAETSPSRMAAESRALVPVTQIKESYVVERPAGTRPVSGEARGSPSLVNAVQLHRDLSAPADSSTYFVNISKREPFQAGGSEMDGSRPGSGSPTASERSARMSPTTEVLMPTHMFVRKKEYVNFKDFTKQEIDALWVKLLGMKRQQGVGREEVQLLVSQAKQSVLSEVMGAVEQQEREILAMLQGIRMQVSQMQATPPLYMTDVTLVRDSGRPVGEVLDGARSVTAAVSPTRLRTIEQQRKTAAPAATKWSTDDSPASSVRSAEAALPMRIEAKRVRRASGTLNLPATQEDGSAFLFEVVSKDYKAPGRPTTTDAGDHRIAAGAVPRAVRPAAGVPAYVTESQRRSLLSGSSTPVPSKASGSPGPKSGVATRGPGGPGRIPSNDSSSASAPIAYQPLHQGAALTPTFSQTFSGVPAVVPPLVGSKPSARQPGGEPLEELDMPPHPRQQQQQLQPRHPYYSPDPEGRRDSPSEPRYGSSPHPAAYMTTNPYYVVKDLRPQSTPQVTRYPAEQPQPYGPKSSSVNPAARRNPKADSHHLLPIPADPFRELRSASRPVERRTEGPAPGPADRSGSTSPQRRPASGSQCGMRPATVSSSESTVSFSDETSSSSSSSSTTDSSSIMYSSSTGGSSSTSDERVPRRSTPKHCDANRDPPRRSPSRAGGRENHHFTEGSSALSTPAVQSAASPVVVSVRVLPSPKHGSFHTSVSARSDSPSTDRSLVRVRPRVPGSSQTSAPSRDPSPVCISVDPGHRGSNPDGSTAGNVTVMPDRNLGPAKKSSGAIRLASRQEL